MAQSTEQRELDLVDKVDFRILEVANNEKKLQDLLSRYLAPLILKAGSEHASVRAKVITVLKRVNTFIQPAGVVLPVSALIDQFKANSSPVVKQFDLVFIQHTLPRMDIDDRRDLFAKVTRDISHGDAGAAGSSDSGFFDVFLRLLAVVQIPSRGTKPDQAFRETLGITDSDGKYLSRWLGKVLLLKSAGSEALSLRHANTGPTFTAPELDFLIPEHRQVSPALAALSDLKLKVITFIGSGAFTDSERFFPALYAASSADSRVSTVGDEILKRSTVDLEDKALVKSLFEAHAQLPPPYRTRIWGLLGKSSASTSMTAEIFEAAKLDIAPIPESGPNGSSAKKQGTLERSKLHRALFGYLRFAATVGPTRGDFAVGAKLTEQMQDYIREQGWPVPQKTSADDMALRSMAYEIIGILGKVSKLTAQQRWGLVAWMFRALAEDPAPEVVVNIDGALSTLTSLYSFQPDDDEVKHAALRHMLLTHMRAKIEPPIVRSTRHAAVKWANRCLPFNCVPARWIDILAVGGRTDERNDVVEEGQKGLDPWAQFAHSGKDLPLPDWQRMLIMYFRKGAEAHTHSETSGDKMDMDIDLGDAAFFNFSGEAIRAFPIALSYIKQMMFLAALRDFKMEPDWSRNLHSLVRTDLKTRGEIRQYLSGLPDPDAHCMFFLKNCLEGMFMGNDAIVEECARCFVEVARLSPRSVIAYVAGEAAQLMPLIKSNKKELRVLAAEAFGILASHPANNDQRLAELMNGLHPLLQDCDNKVGAELNAAEGGLLSCAHFCARLMFNGRRLPQNAEGALASILEGTFPAALQDTIMEVYGMLWVSGLGIPGRDAPTAECFTEKLTSFAKKGNERAISALGKMAIAIDDEGPADAIWSEGPVGAVLRSLFDLHELKQAEVHFAIGEAIASAIACWEADCVKLLLNVDSPSKSYQKPRRPALINGVLDKLIQDCKGTKPSLLKASGIWLFCIVQYCSHLDEVGSRLRELQASFMRLLHTRDELTQETASRGLSLVYERGDESVRAQLTSDLVSAFTGTGTKLKVDQDTELFDAGALPTGDGKSVTSYKDIVNLASEVGDQTLVYKFMSLAANAAMWTTRSAFGRFGLSNILSESEVDPKLYPKLYRYRFDPNPNVQKSMDDIWKAIIKDPNAVLDKYFDDIMQDLLKSALGREWRVREASCGAVADLVHGRPFSKYEKYYTEMWKVAMKLMDDVKGSVREAALKLCVGMSNGLLRLLEESSSGGSVQAMLDEVIPFLLSSQGIDNSVEDVKLFSTLTLIKVAKKGGKSLKPFMPELIPQLLGLLSTIEPEQIGFYYQRLGEGGRDLIDKRRTAMVNQSPISEAVDNCLRFADDEALAALAPNLEAAIKSAVGMPTKIGCGRVLMTLFASHAGSMRPLAPRFLKLMEKQALDANDEVSKGYARAAAVMVRVASDEVREMFCARFIGLYFEAEDETRRRKVGDVVAVLSVTSPDQFASMGATLLPFAYFASHDVDSYTKAAFKSAWDKHAGSDRSVVWHVEEITKYVSRGLEAPRWSLQHTACFTIAGAVEALGSSSDATTGQIKESHLRVVWSVFERALALKTFEGKERLLEAFPVFVEKGVKLWEGDEKIAAVQKKIALREAKRNNPGYKVHAYKCLWKFAKARKDLDMLEEITDVVQPAMDEFLEEDDGGDKMDIDSGGDHAASLAHNGLEAVARGYNRSRMGSDAALVLSIILKTLEPYLSNAKFSGVKKKVWYSALKDLMGDAKTFSTGKDEQKLAQGLLKTLDLDVVEIGTEAQRVERAKAVGAVLKAWNSGVFGGKDGLGAVKGVAEKLMGEERSMTVKEALKKALEESR